MSTFMQEKLMQQIIVFTQDNCGWCVRLHPHIKKLAEDRNIDLEFINITNDWDGPVELGVQLRTTPTVAVYDQGMIIRTFSIEANSGIPGLISRIKDIIT